MVFCKNAGFAWLKCEGREDEDCWLECYEGSCTTVQTISLFFSWISNPLWHLAIISYLVLILVFAFLRCVMQNWRTEKICFDHLETFVIIILYYGLHFWYVDEFSYFRIQVLFLNTAFVLLLQRFWGERTMNTADDNGFFPSSSNAPFRTSDKIWGVRSWDPIAADTFISEYTGQVVPVTEHATICHSENEYVLNLKRA